MEVCYSKQFLKQLADIPQETRVKIENFVFNELITAPSIAMIGKVENRKQMLIGERLAITLAEYLILLLPYLYFIG